MSIQWVQIVAMIALGLLLVGAGCDSLDDTEGTVTIEGTVRYVQLEGGFWAIEGTDGRTYDPVNLPEKFQHDGMRVRVQAVIRDDLGGIHMVGPIIEIRAIEER